MNEFIRDRIQYIKCDDGDTDLPLPPKRVLKAMNRRWANELIGRGLVQLSCPECFHPQHDASGRATKHEGTAVYKEPKGFCQLLEPWYMFSTSHSTIEHHKLIGMANEYDCIVDIRDPHEFAIRMHNAVINAVGGNVACGYCAYKKGNRKLDDERCSNRIIQFDKNPDEYWQKEFRYVIEDVRFALIHDPNSNGVDPSEREEGWGYDTTPSGTRIRLLLGNCRGIIRIA